MHVVFENPRPYGIDLLAMCVHVLYMYMYVAYTCHTPVRGDHTTLTITVREAFNSHTHLADPEIALFR